MSDDGLLAIEIGTDDYAEAAADDTPSVSRTHQSEAQFQAQEYSAKIVDSEDNLQRLVTAVPALASGIIGQEQIRLSKKDVQLLGYAAGELYFDRRYEELLALCDKVEENCVDDGLKVKEMVGRWRARCVQRLGKMS